MLDCLEGIQRTIPVGRITPRETLHLTLAFLDEVEKPLLLDLDVALREINVEGFSLALAGLDVFGGTQSQILYVAVRPCEALGDLQARVTQVVRSAGIELPRRRYRPHVTLARFNRPPRGGEMDRLIAMMQTNALEQAGDFNVERFALFRSDLGRGPAQHTELASYPLEVPGRYLEEGERDGI